MLRRYSAEHHRRRSAKGNMRALFTWRRFRNEGVPLPFIRVVGMSLRRTLTPDVIRAIIAAHKNRLGLEVDQIEAHSLAGGHIGDVVDVLISSRRKNLDIPFMPLAAIDLAGRSVVTVSQDYAEAHRQGHALSFDDFIKQIFTEEREKAEQTNG